MECSSAKYAWFLADASGVPTKLSYRSVVTVEGTPCATQVVTKASATAAALMLGIGTTSGQRVKQSPHVYEYEKP